MTQKQKTKFRTSSKWKKFRAHMKKISKSKDFITGKPLYKGWNLHHLDEPHYDDLNPDKFLCLNKQTHEVLHWLARYEDYSSIAEKLVLIIDRMKVYDKGRD